MKERKKPKSQSLPTHFNKRHTRKKFVAFYHYTKKKYIRLAYCCVCMVCLSITDMQSHTHTHMYTRTDLIVFLHHRLTNLESDKTKEKEGEKNERREKTETERGKKEGNFSIVHYLRSFYSHIYYNNKKDVKTWNIEERKAKSNNPTD